VSVATAEEPPSPERFSESTLALELVRELPRRRNAMVGYEDVPILKPPVWGWEIACYFFVEGVSAGIYTLGTVADLVGVRRYVKTVAYGRLLALFAMMPAPALLILDLGRPERFHHMLRVFKPRSPMNLGTWALTGYALFTTLRAMKGLGRALPRIPLLTAMLEAIPERLASVAGLPFAITMLSYPGVLLESTSIPVWSHTPLLGPLIAASSLGSGAAAMSLVGEFTRDETAIKLVSKMENASAVAEGVCLGAYFATAKRASKPLVHGKQSKLFWIGAVALGMIIPAILRRRKSKTARIASSALTLAGSFALKWAITHAGTESSRDRELANRNAGH
jgi:formate-dependent nitrite reductase membrane component NrfD